MKTAIGPQYDRKKILAAIQNTPAGIRENLLRWFRRDIQARKSSELWARRNPRCLAVDDDQRAEMLAAHEAGVSFRALERIFHLVWQSGNDAQRCCNRAAELRAEGAGPKPSVGIRPGA